MRTKSVKSWEYIFFGLLSVLVERSIGEPRPHHKVHNLALYPERHSWCTPTPIRQQISAHLTECQPLTIDNVVCLGACFSYNVPKAQGDAVIAPYCDACRPTLMSWTTVSLNCTKAETGEQYFLPRSVEIFKNCSCVDCSDTSYPKDDNEASGDSNDSGEDVNNSIESFSLQAANNLVEDEDLENGEDDLPAPPIPQGYETRHYHSIHKLRSTSQEIPHHHKATPSEIDEEERMIQENKIHPDEHPNHKN